MKVNFKAYEYNADDSFSEALYEFEGETSDGWAIRRNASDFRPQETTP
jgi:hypothetical protein